MTNQKKRSWLSRLSRRSLFKWIVPLGMLGSLFNPSSVSAAPPGPPDPPDPFNPNDPSDFTTAFIRIDDYASFAVVLRDGRTDWLPAVMQAQAQWQPSPTSGFSLYFGPTTYQFSGPIHLVRGMSIIGSGGAEFNQGTTLIFNLNLDSNGNPIPTSGIICDRPTTAPPSTPGRGDGSLIERVALVGFFDPNALGNPYQGTVHGIVMYARANVRDARITQFHGDGVHIEADVHLPTQTNANGWQLTNVRIDLCGGNGVFVKGGDTNAGCALAVDCADHKGWGFYDDSFLGNTYIACQAANCALGAYATIDRNARSLFLNCYSENGQPPSQITAPSVVLGGIMAIAGSALWLTADEFIATFRNSIQGGSLGGNVFGALGSNTEPDAALELHQSADYSRPYRFHYGHQHAGWWELIYAGLDAGTPLRVSTNAAADIGNQGGHIWFENGFFIGFGTNRFNVYTGNAKPQGASAVGTRVLNSNPQPGDPDLGYEGWIYTPSGWKGFGLIQT